MLPLFTKRVGEDSVKADSDWEVFTGTWTLNRHREKPMNGNIEIVLVAYSAWIAVGLAALVWTLKDKVHRFLPECLKNKFD